MRDHLALVLDREGGAIHATLQQNGVTVASRRTISQGDYQKLHFVTDLYRQHTRAPAPALLTDAALVAVGIEMFNLWLAADWPTCLSEHRHLTVVSNDLELLLLPWEVVQPPGELFLGVNPRWSLDRQVAPQSASPCPTSPCGLLFFQSQPNDRPPLESFFSPSSPLPSPPLLSGTLEELKTALALEKPTLLFLHGHALVRGTNGYFAFCEESGEATILTATELASLLRPFSHLRGVILCGREENHPPPAGAIHAVCRQLSTTLPCILAWPDAPLAHRCQTLTTTFIQALLQGQSLPTATTLARQQAFKQDGEMGYPGWSLMGLYGQPIKSPSV